MSSTETAVETPVETPAKPTPLQRLRRPLMILGPLVVVCLALYFYLTGGRHQSTNDANVQAARVAISSNVAGRVVEVAVRDNQPVRRGEVLFRLDDAPFRIAVREAQAQLAAATLQVDSLKAKYRQRTVADDSRRREALRVPAERAGAPAAAAGLRASPRRRQVDRATHALDDARGALATAQQQTGAVRGAARRRCQHPARRSTRAVHAGAGGAGPREARSLLYPVIAAADGVVTRVEAAAGR